MNVLLTFYEYLTDICVVESSVWDMVERLKVTTELNVVKCKF